MCLFDKSLKKQNDEYRFLAAIHGIDLSSEGKAVNRAELPEGVSNQKEFVFADPSTYEKMSEEEKQELTNKMMQNWSSFIGKRNLGG